MLNIEYACITSNSRELQITKPTGVFSNSNQYLVSFSSNGDGDELIRVGGGDYRKQPSTVCIIGDWEYDGFFECLIKASDYIHNGAVQGTKNFCCQEDVVALTISHKADHKAKVRFKFKFQQAPIRNGASWRTISDRVFAFYVNASELEDFANTLYQLQDDVEFVPILNSNREDWACSLRLSHPDSTDAVACASIKGDAISHIVSEVPKGLHEHWCGLIDSIPDYNVAECKSCKGIFIQDIHWKKECYGCYTESKATAISKSDLENVSLGEWLTAIALSDLDSLNDV